MCIPTKILAAQQSGAPPDYTAFSPTANFPQLLTVCSLAADIDIMGIHSPLAIQQDAVLTQPVEDDSVIQMASLWGMLVLATAMVFFCEIPAVAAQSSNSLEEVISVEGNPDIQFSLHFLGRTVKPGQIATMQYSISNAGSENLEAIAFTHQLQGLISTSGTLPNVCGQGSTLAGETFLVLNNASLPGGTTCTFSISIQVPLDAPPNRYRTVTSSLFAAIDHTPLQVPPAVDTLLVADPIVLSQIFQEEAARAGDTVTLTYTLANSDTLDSVHQLQFSHDLDGLIPQGLPLIDICGTGSQLSGTAQLEFTGGSLDANQSCSFDVAVKIPKETTATRVQTQASPLAGQLRDTPVFGPAGTSTLDVGVLFFHQDIASSNPGGTAEIWYTIRNTQPGAISELQFEDNLQAVVGGLTIVHVPEAGFCGPTSQITGTDTLAVTGVHLSGNDRCSFYISVAVPETTFPGEYTNSVPLIFNNNIAAVAESATFTVHPNLPVLVAEFFPTTVTANEESILTVEIDGSNPIDLNEVTLIGVVADSMRFSGALTSTCHGAVQIQTADTSVIQMSGASLPADGTCTVQVPVTGRHMGTYGVALAIRSEAGISAIAKSSLNIGPKVQNPEEPTAPSGCSTAGRQPSLLLVLLWLGLSFVQRKRPHPTR